MTPKSIITYLPTGDPQGLKTLELSGWIGKSLVIPRSSIKEIKTRPEAARAAVYFLFGEGADGVQRAYIGESTNLHQRLTNHDTNKDFWEYAVVFVSNSESLSSTEIKYLEARAIELAMEAKRFTLENSKEQIQKSLPEWKVAELEEFLRNIDLLLSFSGFPILQKPARKFADESTVAVYECKGPDAEAKGVYQSDGFLVLKGSVSRRSLTPTAPAVIRKIQEYLLSE